MNCLKDRKHFWNLNRVNLDWLCRLACLLMSLALLGSALPVWAQSGTVVFRDDFTSPLNSNTWGYYDNTYSIHRTQFGNAPEVDTANGYMRLHLDTYNSDPTYGKTFLKGTEMFSKTKFPVGAGGVEFEARVRGTNIPAGTLGAFFTFGDKGVYPDSYLWDEVDYEILGNYPSNQLWLNIWDDYSPVNGGPHLDSHPTITGLNWKNWTDYKVRAYPYVTQFYVNNVLVRSSYDIVPTDPMALRFNIWAPDSSWTAAYNSAITTTTAADNKDYYFDVDYVQVKSLSPGAVGKGDGLSASYYNSENLTGTPVTRIDPQVNFNWGNASPATGINSDGFSARWTGQVLAPFTETYTFTTNSDDGVRLFVNGQQLVDNWTNHGPTENSGTITLTAGVRYDIKMEYYDHAFGAVAQLFWSSPSLPRRAIPQSQLYSTSLPTPTPTPLAVAITTPKSGSTLTSLPAISGTAGGTNLSRVNIYLRRLSDSKYWTGTAWGTTKAIPLTTSLSNGKWTRTSGLPVASSDSSNALTNDSYYLAAFGYDTAGNYASIGAKFTAKVAVQPTPTPTPSQNWQATDLAVGSDNLSRLLWVRSDKAFSIWSLSASNAVTNTPPITPPASWGPYGIGVGGDLKVRALLNNTNAQASISTFASASSGAFTSSPTYGPYSGFVCRDIAVAKDNTTRLMWVRSDGALTVWTVDTAGNFVNTPLLGPISGWSPVALSVDGNGKTCVLLDNVNGQTAVWTIQGATSGSVTSTPALGPPSGFTCIDFAMGSDNKARLLWARSDKAFVVWTVQDSSSGTTSSTPLYGPIAGWGAQKVGVGGDLKTRLLLTNTDGRAAVWTLDSSGAYNTTPNFGPVTSSGASPARSAFPAASRSKAPAPVIGGPGPLPPATDNQPSSIVLSSAAASAAAGAVTLNFTGQLDANTATNVSRYKLSVDGAGAGVVKADISPAGTSVTLTLAAGALSIGDSVDVGYSLLDAKGLRLSGSASINAR